MGPSMVNATFSLSAFRNVTPVKIVVGESNEHFYVHKDILCNVSPFFKAALAGGFREAKEQVLSFPEDDGDTFEKFVKWIYTQSLDLPPHETFGDANVRYLALARLFVLADKLQIQVLKDITILAMYQSVLKAKWIPNFEVIAHIFEEEMWYATISG